MKKTYLVLLFLAFSLLFIGKKLYAYSATGHDDFKKITFVDGDYRLLNEYSSKEISDAYAYLSHKGFGWVTYFMNIEEKATYDGVTIFSRSNNTKDCIDFDYYLKENNVTTCSVSVSGSVSTKVTGTIKKINVSSGLDFSTKKTTETENSTEEKTSFTFTIYPGKKLTMLVTGVCYVTTAVSKYYFLGICTKKGSWEKIDVETVIYELREERI